MLEFDNTPRGLTRLVYASRARGAEGEELVELVRRVLVKSIHNNRMSDVTGFLVSGEGQFLQLLEGPAGEIETTFERIRRDERHDEIAIISRGTVGRRLFRDWNMALHSIGAADQGVMAKAGLETFTPGALDEAAALVILTTLGAQHLR